MIFNVGAGGATDADKIKYGDSNVGATLDNLNESVDELNESLGNLLYIKEFSSLKLSTSSASSTDYFDVSVEGYEAVGILGYTIGGSGFANVSISVLRIDDGNTLYVRSSGTGSTSTLGATILYIKKNQNNI